ncbi:hypothetical protein BH10PSE2_BH10PSE2_14990 [soil metagenome]
MVRPVSRAGLVTLAVLSLLAACDKRQPAAPAAPTAPAVTPTTTPAVPTVPASDSNVLTADGLGLIRVGQTIGEVQTSSGEPEIPIAAPNDCNIFHPSRAPAGVMVMTEEGRVTRVTLGTGSTIKTAQGFGVGSAAVAIKGALGGGVIVQPAKYETAPAQDLYAWSTGGSTDYVTDPNARGIRYEVGTDGKVKSVHAGGPSIQLAESCG